MLELGKVDDSVSILEAQGREPLQAPNSAGKKK